MSSPISPFRATQPRGETTSTGRIKPEGQPRTDRFKKLSEDRESPREEATEELDEEKKASSSVFDLSRAKNNKPTKPDSPSNQPSLAETSVAPEQEGEDLSSLSAPKSAFSSFEEPSVLEDNAKSDDAWLTYVDGFSDLSRLDKKAQSSMPTGEMTDPSLMNSDDLLQNASPPSSGEDVVENEFNRHQSLLLNARKNKKVEEDEFRTDYIPVEKDEEKIQAVESFETGADSSFDRPFQPATPTINLEASAVRADVQDKAQFSRAATIQEIVTQIVERIQVMTQEGKTDTMITLRNPPILEGATITLTTFSHARNEFNISFANLSQAGKQFLDQKLAEESLTSSLERKGIAVHMLTTTTQAEPLISQEAGQAPRDQEEQQRQQQQQQRQQPDEEEG